MRGAFGEEDQENQNGGDDANDRFMPVYELEKLKKQFEGVEISQERKGWCSRKTTRGEVGWSWLLWNRSG